jgi:hypothetical protein
MKQSPDKEPVGLFRVVALEQRRRLAEPIKVRKARFGGMDEVQWVTMTEGSFEARTLANMNVALDPVWERSPLGEQHDIRQRVAQGIIQCARSGRTTVGALTEAGKRSLVHIPEAA